MPIATACMASSAVIANSSRQVVRTEVGDYCSPIHDDTEEEALVEYRHLESVGLEDHHAEDNADNGNVVLRCGCWEDACEKDMARTCLRRDTCYTFIVGDNFQRIPSEVGCIDRVDPRLF